MADIELVIKMSEEDYEKVIKYDDLSSHLYKAIQNGTPLPKGHGRLVDADELDEDKQIMTTIFGESKFAVRMDDIRKAQTIIESDKEDK